MGYWEEKAKYEKERLSLMNQVMQSWHCNHCGEAVKKLKAACSCSGALSFKHFLSGNLYTGKYELCSNCAKKCKDCGRYFCPKHINNHTCRSEDDNSPWKCDHCKEIISLTKKEQNELDKNGKIEGKCPYCKKITLCEEG